MKSRILAFAFIAAILSISFTSNAQTETRTIAITDTYDAISLAGNQELNFEIGPAGQPVTVIGNSTDLDNLEIYVEKNTLRIKYPNNYRPKSKSVQIYVKNPALTSASVAGSGIINVNGKLDKSVKSFSVAGSGMLNVPEVDGDAISLSVAGSGKVNIKIIETDKLTLSVAGSGTVECHDVNAGSVSASVAGSGQAKMEGKAASFNASVAGSGKLNAQNLIAKEGDAKVSGSGRIDCKCTDRLTATVHGSGNVYYYGRPETVKFSGKTGNIIQK